jgi:hypothetical protein
VYQFGSVNTPDSSAFLFIVCDVLAMGPMPPALLAGDPDGERGNPCVSYRLTTEAFTALLLSSVITGSTACERDVSVYMDCRDETKYAQVILMLFNFKFLHS